MNVHGRELDLKGVAAVLTRCAEMMWEQHTVDDSNALLNEAFDDLLSKDFDAFEAMRSQDAMLFLHASGPFWRHRFARVEAKVHAYLIAAAMATEEASLKG